MELSLSRDEALSQGVLKIEPGAKVAPSVRIVPAEDDGTSLGPVLVKAGATVRDGVILGTGASIGAHAVVGHNVVVRAGVRIGDRTVVSHQTVLETHSQIGSDVRISALTHITGRCVIEDNVQIGAGVRTINDNEMRWREAGVSLSPPTFRKGCRIGTGSTILGGVEIGENSIIGAGALVTRTVPKNVVAFGHPSYIQRGR